MALDPNLLLQSTSFQDAFNKQQAALAQQQETQNQLQMQRYSVAQAKQAFEDTQNMRTAWHQANGDPAETIRIVSQLGVSPQMIQKYQAQQIATQQEMANLEKTRTETGKTQLDIQTAKHTALGNLLAPVANGDPNDVAGFSKNLQGAISTARSQGLITSDEALQYAQMTPAQAQTAYRQLIGWQANAKSVKDLADANKANVDASVSQQKQANESGGQQADSILKQRGAVSPQLEGALNSGNPLAYGQTLTKLDPTGKLGFPSQDDVKAMNPAQAINMVRSLATSSEDKIKNEQAQAQLQQQGQFQQQEIALRKQSNAMQQQELNLKTLSTQADLFEKGLGMDGKPLPENDKNLLSPNVQNTSDGRTFIDQDSAFKGMPKAQQFQLKQAAAAQGIPMLSSKDAAAIQATDNARNTINGVFATYMKNSASGANGVVGHMTGAIGGQNYLGVVTQINPELAGARQNFLASIDALKTAGGQGSGFRITAGEISKIGGLMPGLNDTQETLRSKAAQINEIVNGKLNSALHQVPVNNGNRGNTGGPTGGVLVTAPDGTVLNFPNLTSANAFKKAHGIQ